MALTQHQFGELAREALEAQQAYDALRAACEELLAGQHEPAAKLALLAYVLEDLPVLGCPKSEAALVHIERTRKRNTKRALEAREARKGRSER